MCIMLYKNCFPCLIFTPYSAIAGWKEDFKICGIKKYIHIKGTKKKRLELLNYGINNNIKFFITHKECHLSIGEDLSTISWGSVILDESTCIKNYGTHISNYFTQNFRSVKRRFILTGTPMPENELDIYQQILFLDPMIFNDVTNFYHFRNKYFKQTIDGWKPTTESKEIIANKLSKCCYVMSTKDAGLFTEKVYERKTLKLKTTTMKAYRNFVKNFVLKFDGEIYKVTDWVLAQFTSLRQLCGGFLKDPETGIYKFIDNSKANLIIELLQVELLNNKVLIWCDFIHEVDMLSNLLNKNNISNLKIYGTGIKKHVRDLRVKKFQDSEVDVLIGNPSCFEEGTTLNNADTTIFYSSPLGGKKRSQTEKRMSNPFKREVDLIIDLIAEETIEERIIKSHIRKEKRQTSMINLIKFLQYQYKMELKND